MSDSDFQRHGIENASASNVMHWFWAGIVWLLAWVAVFHDALRSAVNVWLINDTFNHCFFVLPAVLYVIWQQRGSILKRAPSVSVVGGLAVLLVMFVYALGLAAYVELLQHLAVFALVPAVILFLFGWKVFLGLWAPLLFIFFSVPVGEELVPLFQNITADMSVALLKLVGVPVYRNGLYITVPNGSFVVAEACSGIRFFIACVVIGCAYAYLNFVTAWRASVFIVFSVVMPIVANGIRAFGIIYIGHATDMEHAVGADHLIYGWFFFAFVVVLLVGAGFLFSDGQRQWQNQITQVDNGWQQNWRPLLLGLAALPFILALLAKIAVGQGADTARSLDPAGLNAVAEQRAVALPWTPRFYAADQYRIAQNTAYGAQYFQAIYLRNRPDQEMISWSHRMFDIDAWSLSGQFQTQVEGLGSVTVLDLTSLGGRKRLLAYWFVIPNKISSRQSVIKLYQAINTLLLQPSGGSLVAVNLDYQGSTEEARTELDGILRRDALSLSRLVRHE